MPIADIAQIPACLIADVNMPAMTESNSTGAFTPLSKHGSQGEMKYGAARFIRLCPQPAPMGVDDRPANRQPHPRAAGLRGVKCIEHALEMRRIEARPGIAHRHNDTCVVLLGADQQLSWLCLNRAHCFDRVQDQVQDYLLQLNAIAVNGK